MNNYHNFWYLFCRVWILMYHRAFDVFFCVNIGPATPISISNYSNSVSSSSLLIILLLDRPLCPDGMLIVGWWSSSPRTEAKETLDSIPIELRFYSRPVVVATLLFPT